jgi:hypothetical protein
MSVSDLSSEHSWPLGYICMQTSFPIYKRSPEGLWISEWTEGQGESVGVRERRTKDGTERSNIQFFVHPLSEFF